MSSLKFLFKKYNLEEVFTPSTYAKLTYVSRKSLESDLEKYLKIPGMQLVLYGHSGCGKSTMVYNTLQNKKRKCISTSCVSTTTFEELLFKAFDQLNVYYQSELSSSRSTSSIDEIKAKSTMISAMLSQVTVDENSEKRVRALPLQLTPERLAQFLGEANCVWVIEDFHKVAEQEKKKLADVLKIFMDCASKYPSVKIICLGAVSTARELVILDPDLSQRVAEVFIPLLSDNEIAKIAETGFDLLNVSFDELLEEKIVYYSNNLASICHQLCFDLCVSENVEKSRVFSAYINDSDFNNAVIAYVKKNSDTIKKPFDKIASNVRRVALLEGMINTQKESMSIEEIFSETKKIIKINQEELSNLMGDLQNPEFGEVVRYDANSKKYIFSTPFFQAFLKMQLEIDKAERKNRENKKRRRQHYTLVQKRGLFYLREEIFINKDIEKEYLNTINLYFRRRQELEKELARLQNSKRA